MIKTTQGESLPRLTAQNVIFKISSLYLVDTVKIIQLENRKIHCNQLKTTIMDLHSVYFLLSDFFKKMREMKIFGNSKRVSKIPI